MFCTNQNQYPMISDLRVTMTIVIKLIPMVEYVSVVKMTHTVSKKMR